MCGCKCGCDRVNVVPFSGENLKLFWPQISFMSDQGRCLSKQLHSQIRLFRLQSFSQLQAQLLFPPVGVSQPIGGGMGPRCGCSVLQGRCNLSPSTESKWSRAIEGKNK